MAHHVKIVLGTDAVAGAHGRNAEEFIYRVQDGGQPPMDAIVSGTSLAAESLGFARQDRNHCGRDGGGHCRRSRGIR